jgi:UDP-N-acetyl-2-amino-2-deoxyglucuronate dehydrogenase
MNKKLNIVNKMKKKFNIGILGVGRISKKHILAIHKNNSFFRILALCDTKIKKLDTKLKVLKFNSINQMLKNNLKFDLISICTPSGLHKSHAIQCLKKGINVLIEKPMALNKKDSDDIINAGKKYKKKVFICLQNRFNPTIQLLKKEIDKNKFGKIYFVNVNIFWNRDQKYYDQDKWRGTKKLDGGALMNQSIHFIDLLIWLFGPIKKKQILRSKLARKIETEDTASINIMFQKRILCSVSSTMLTNNKNYEGSITIIGEKGTVKIGGIALNKIIDWKINGKEMSRMKKEKINYKLSSVYGDGHNFIYREIYRSFKNKKSNPVLGKDGIKSVEFIDDLYNSSKLL